MNLKEAIDRFLEYCELDKNLSPKTVRMYAYYLNFFGQWTENKQVTSSVIPLEASSTKKATKPTINVEEINEELIRNFRLYLSREYFNPFKGELKRQTQN